MFKKHFTRKRLRKAWFHALNNARIIFSSLLSKNFFRILHVCGKFIIFHRITQSKIALIFFDKWSKVKDNDSWLQVEVSSRVSQCPHIQLSTYTIFWLQYNCFLVHNLKTKKQILISSSIYRLVSVIISRVI